MNLIPASITVLGDPGVCFAHRTSDGHIVVYVKYVPFDPDNPGPSWTLDGKENTDDLVHWWSTQDLIDEFSAGFVGAMMDCYNTHDKEGQDELLDHLPGSAGFTFYEYLKKHVCDWMEFLFSPECDIEDRDTQDNIDAILLLAEFCQHTLLDDLMKKIQRCDTEPTPTPDDEPEEEPTVDPRAQGSGCACQAWPGWVICENCTNTIYCTCPGDCIPIPASSRNC